MVYIQSKNGTPLMPTENQARVRCLLKAAKAKVVKLVPIINDVFSKLPLPFSAELAVLDSLVTGIRIIKNVSRSSFVVGYSCNCPAWSNFERMANNVRLSKGKDGFPRDIKYPEVVAEALVACADCVSGNPDAICSCVERIKAFFGKKIRERLEEFYSIALPVGITMDEFVYIARETEKDFEQSAEYRRLAAGIGEKKYPFDFERR